MGAKKTAAPKTKSLGVRLSPELKRRLGAYLNEHDEDSRQSLVVRLLDAFLTKEGYKA